jgi:hypothetical protein
MAHHLSTEILRGLVGVPPDASPLETRTALQATVKQALAAETDEVYPYLAHLLGRS